MNEFLNKFWLKFSKRLEIDDISLRGDLIIVRELIVLESLMFFFVTMKPITRLRFIHGFKEFIHFQEILFLEIILKWPKCAVPFFFGDEGGILHS